MIRLPLRARRVVPAVLVAACLLVAAPVSAQQPDPTVLSNPHQRRTLKVDPSTWQTSATLAPEVRARVEAAITQQRALKAARQPAAQKVGSLLRIYQREAAAQPTVVGRMWLVWLDFLTTRQDSLLAHLANFSTISISRAPSPPLRSRTRDDQARR